MPGTWPSCANHSKATQPNKMPDKATGMTSVSIQTTFCHADAPKLRRKAYSRTRPKKTEVYTAKRLTTALHNNKTEISVNAKG